MDSFARIGGGFVEEHHRVSRMLEEGCFWGLQISPAGVPFATPTWPASSPRHLTSAAVVSRGVLERGVLEKKCTSYTQIASGRRSPRF